MDELEGQRLIFTDIALLLRLVRQGRGGGGGKWIRGGGL